MCCESSKGNTVLPILQTFWPWSPFRFWHIWNWLTWNSLTGNTDLRHCVPVTITHCTMGSNVLSLVTYFPLMKEGIGRKEWSHAGRKERGRKSREEVTSIIGSILFLEQALGYVIQRDFFCFWNYSRKMI